MNTQVPVEQLCEVGLCTLFGEHSQDVNSQEIRACVENTYKAIHRRAAEEKKTLVGVTQNINTELIQTVHGVETQTLFIITLVGTAVDTAMMEAQQRISQFDPRNAMRGRTN